MAGAGSAVTQAAEEPIAAAVVVAGVRAGLGARVGAGGRTSDFTTNPLAAVDGLFVRDADADGAGHFARNLAGFVAGVLHRAVFRHALIGADLDLLFTILVAADRDLALDGFGHADLLANRHRAFTVLGAVNPDLAGAGRTASVVARVGRARIGAGVAAAVAVTTEETAVEAAEERLNFTAFPVAQADELLLHAGFLHVLVARLVHDAVFPRGHLVADLAGLFFPNRNALGARDDFLLAHRNAFGPERVDRLLTTLDLIGGPFHLVIFFHPFIASRGTEHGGRRA